MRILVFINYRKLIYEYDTDLISKVKGSKQFRSKNSQEIFRHYEDITDRNFEIAKVS